MGEQSHYSESTFTDIDVLGQLFQTYQSQFNLPIAITEFDVESSSAQLQADYLRDYMTMSFSQGKVDQFILWGFWSQMHWKPGSALYNADFSIRPNGQVYEDWSSAIGGPIRVEPHAPEPMPPMCSKAIMSLPFRSAIRQSLNRLPTLIAMAQ